MQRNSLQDAWLPQPKPEASTYNIHKFWDEITYPFPNFSDRTFEVW